MHDTDTFSQMSALDSKAEPLPLTEILSTFEKVLEVKFKEETYLVRDNGAVYRCARPYGRRRRLDQVWTFGTPNRHSGYFEINGHVVHRIVAVAFHGPKPSSEHVVDHIDTNRKNNRPENLRWVTRLENILLNPITCARIVKTFGSLEAFFENPRAATIPNLEWMKVVTKEAAQECRKNLLKWAETGEVGKDGALGDWIYKPTPKYMPPDPIDTPSLTPGAIQRKWRTPTEFPHCPGSVSSGTLQDYLTRITPGAVFCRNQYGENTVIEATIGPDGVLSVVCSTPSGVKGWSHACVFLAGEKVCHESGGMFFSREGAMKAHCIAIGAPTDGYEDSIDDYC